jgi:tetratricopeptide (TPR) repeat protein
MKVTPYLVLLFFLLQTSTAFCLEPSQWFEEGNRFSSEGNFERAIEAYKKSIEGNPLSPVAHYNLGIAYKNIKAFDKAVQSLEKSIELEPVNMDARVTLGNVYNLQERWEEAIGQLNIVIHRKKSDAQAHGNLGWAYYNYKKGPRFKKMVILNLSHAVELFEEQGQPQAAAATRKIIDEAKNKFGYSLIQ